MPGAPYFPCHKCGSGPTHRALEILAECKRRDPRGHSDGIFDCRNVRGGSTLSVHACGRAIDFAPSSRAAGDALAAWLTGPEGPSDIQGVIWYRHAWGFQTHHGWVAYYGDDPHTSHLHIETNRAAGDYS